MNNVLPSEPQRIMIIGATGSGKSTLARKLAEHFNLQHIELDKLLFDTNKIRVSDNEFKQRVTEISSQPSWLCDGIFYNIADVIWPKAEIVIWVDTPSNIIFRRVLKRSLYRIVTKATKPGGERETLKTAFGKQGIVRVTPHVCKNVQREYPDLISKLGLEDKLIRISSQQELRSWLRLNNIYI